MVKIQKAAILFLLSLLLWHTCSMPVHAADDNNSSASMIGIRGEWDGLEGDAKYLGQKYRDNYALDQDAGKLDLVEKAGNGLANVFWGLCTSGTQVGCAVIYYAMDFNLAEFVGDKLNALEATLVNNVFNRIFPLAFLGVGCMLLFRLWKRDVIGGFSDIAKTVILVCISIGLSINASSILTLTSNLTKQVNQAIMSGINGQSGFSSNADDFAKEAAGILWTDMVHVPWMTLEFGNDAVSEADVERVLASKGDERTDIIKELSGDMDCFAPSRCWTRLGNVLLYLFPWLAKLVVFVLIAALQLAFQAAVLLLFSTAPIVLIIALVTASGFNVVKRWAGTLLDFHIDMIALSFLLSILVWIDKLLFGAVKTFGWFIVVLLQTAICVFVFFKRSMILGFLVAGRGHGVENIVEKAGETVAGAAGDVGDALGSLYNEESVINAARNTSFTEAYNAADYADGQDANHGMAYNSMDTGPVESSDVGYRKEREAMSPQDVYEAFQEPRAMEDPQENVRQDSSPENKDHGYDTGHPDMAIPPESESGYNSTDELTEVESGYQREMGSSMDEEADVIEEQEESAPVVNQEMSSNGMEPFEPEEREVSTSPQEEMERPEAQDGREAESQDEPPKAASEVSGDTAEYLTKESESSQDEPGLPEERSKDVYSTDPGQQIMDSTPGADGSGLSRERPPEEAT